MPEHQQISILRLVATAQQDDQAEHPARQHVGDLEQHPASQAPPRPARRPQRRSTTPIEYSSGTGSGTPDAFPPDGLALSAEDLAFEITCQRNLVPERPGRRYERKTKRPGGRYKTRKPGQTARLTR
jgi:hypothetical protein